LVLFILNNICSIVTFLLRGWYHHHYVHN
jgi:hypothetical protein